MPFETAGVQCNDPTGDSLETNSTPMATMPIAVPTLPVVASLEHSGDVISESTKTPIKDFRLPAYHAFVALSGASLSNQ